MYSVYLPFYFILFFGFRRTSSRKFCFILDHSLADCNQLLENFSENEILGLKLY